MNYKKLIQDHRECFTDTAFLTDFLDAYVTDTREVTELDDYISEYADSEVPIYNQDRAEMWLNTPKAQDLTIEYGGEYPKDAGVFEIMGIDLFYYYQDRLKADYDAFIELATK